DRHLGASPAGVETTFGERHGQPAVGTVVRGPYQSLRRKIDHQTLQGLFRIKIQPGWYATYEIVKRFKVLAAAEFTTPLAKEHNHIAGILESPAHHAIGVFEHSHHADDRSRINGFAVGLVVETDIAAGDWHVQGAASFANTFHRSRELPHDRRPLRVAE